MLQVLLAQVEQSKVICNIDAVDLKASVYTKLAPCSTVRETESLFLLPT